MHTEVQKSLFLEVVNVIENYFEQNKSSHVVDYIKGTELKDKLDLTISESGISSTELIDEIKKYLKYTPRTSHPQFANQLSGGYQFEAMLGELISFVGNNTMATYEVSPVASLIEAELVKLINDIIGIKDGDGIMLTGGSNANLMAIHCARERKFPDVKRKGNQGLDLCLFVSNEAHYSHKKAMMLMGLGLDNLIMVEADKSGRMIASDLDKKIEAAKALGKTPLIVCSTAGTTVLGAFDPIDEIDVVAKKHKLWHHVDGAWGGAVMFSPKYKKLMKGIELVDSYTFDAHKLMGTGLITSFFTTRHPAILSLANSGGGSQYIFHEYENAQFDTGRKSLQCGRKVDALKFWLQWKSKGHSGFAKFVEDQYEKQNYMVSLINENPRLKLVAQPEYLNVCFQVIPTDESLDINEYNLDLRSRLVKEGKMLTNFSRFNDGTIFFRHIFANNITENKHTDQLISHLLSDLKEE